MAEGRITSNKDYLGDGVYAEFDGYSVIVTTENGLTIDNRIVMEPAVLAALDRYRKRVGAS